MEYATLKPNWRIHSRGHVLLRRNDNYTVTDVEARILVDYAGTAAEKSCLRGIRYWANDLDFKDALIWLVVRYRDCPSYESLSREDELQFMRVRIAQRRSASLVFLQQRRIKAITRVFAAELHRKRTLTATEIRMISNRLKLSQRPEKHMLIRKINEFAREFEDEDMYFSHREE